ncbi:MAG: CBS domain-containing protein [Desulfosarcina sp.]|nr:CBS domain-containing protein [Desulfobacterales bacterium]
MYVGTVMRTDLITVPPETTLVAAQEILEQKKINHLLIVDRSNELLGIVSDRDLKRSWASSATTLSKNELMYLLDQVTVADIMTKKTLTITPATTIERAALQMNQHRINALPVLEDDNLVGIITSRDVMGVLLEAIGIEKDSARLTVLVKDRIGVISDISQSLRAEEINMRSLFSWPEKAHPGVYYLVLRVPAEAGAKATACLEKDGFKVLTRYTQDLDPYLPEG